MVLPQIAKAQPTADFTSNIVSGCSPILVQFTDQSTGNPTSWYWDLGNGTTSTQQNPSTLYVTPGLYTVILTVTNGSGSNTKTLTNYINVIPSPTANFTASDSGIFCPPKAIQFTNLSAANSPGAATYFWDFGDGVTSTLQSPSHIYNSQGNYTVTLNITNSANCSKIYSKTSFIQMYARPVTGFTSVNNNSCSYPVSVAFNNTTTGATSYQWNFGDGNGSTQTNPTHNYTVPGSYTVSLISTNASGCKDTLIAPVFVNIGVLNPSFTKSNTTICTNNPISFTNTSTPGTGISFWNFGDGGTGTGTSVTHTYTTPGTYNATLIVDYNGCIDSVSQPITVVQSPSPSFTAASTTGCNVPFNVSFSNTTTGSVTGFLWLFGDGGTSTATNPTHTYTSLGNFTVRLVSYGANGCSDTMTQNSFVIITPGLLGLTPDSFSGCVPATVNFNSNWMYPVSTMSSYTWNFGDGNSITTSSSTVSHTYTTQGTYTATVTALSTTGCAYTTNNPVTVKVGTLPVPSFTGPTSACPSEPVQFTNTSNSNNPGVYNYTWRFGDGNTSTQVSPNHIYFSQGVFTVTLIAENNGCKDSVTQQIIINPPAAIFTPIFSCTSRKEVSFVNSSTGGALFWWDFGDGDTSTLQNPPPHTYANFGSYTVLLKVTHIPSMCISINTAPVLLFDLDAQFTASDTIVCRNQSTVFTATPSPYITDYIWDFGDGNTQTTTTNSVPHTYTVSGLFNVRLIVKDIRGCFDTLIKPNYILVSGPIADFAGVPTSGCSPLLVNFNNLSNSGGNSIVSTLWRFGDGGTSTATTPTVSHTYNRGVFTVTLIITNATGCTDSVTKVNYINAIKPKALFTATPTIICPDDTVHFNNTSTTNNIVNPNLTYQWDFGDGGTSTSTNPSHVYTTTGNYTVRLIAFDGPCSDTLIRTNYISVGGVNLSFTASDTISTCPPLTATFTNTSINGYNFAWSFGNGNVSTLNPATTFYPNQGVYTVKLSGQNGICYDTISKTITVTGPSGTFSYAPLTGCAPLTVIFTSSNVNTQQLTWDMNNGVTITNTASSISYTYTQPGKYVPKLLLGDGVNCIIPVIGTDTITVNSINADFTYAPATLCQSGIIQFKDTTFATTSPVTSRSWNFGDGGTSILHNPTHVYNTPGVYTVTLITSTGQACNDTVIKSVTILAPPVVSAGSNISACQGDTTPIQLQASGAASYVWSPATGLSCTTCPNPTVVPTNTTTYTVIGTGANGCLDTAQTTINILPLPNVQTGPGANICLGASVQLAASGASTYVWSPATGLSCTTCANPVASPSVTTVYTVTGTATSGCKNTAQVTVSVDTIPSVKVIASDSTLCAGDTSQLQASGGTTYLWSPTAGLSCTNCPNPKANPTVTTTYTVTGIGSTGCNSNASVTITVAPLPIVAAANQAVCSGFATSLLATGASTYAWSPATGLSCTNCPNPIAQPSATTNYTITGTSTAGCKNTGQVTVTVNPLPTLTLSSNQTICLGTPIGLQASGAASYSWSPATGLSCNNCANPIANPTTTTTYTVIATDGNGCKDTGQVTVTVNPLPVVDAGPDQWICNLNSVTLTASGAATYSWSPATALSCNNCPAPVASPSSTTTYTVTGTDINGCQNSDNVTVNLYPQPQIGASGDTIICEGQSIQLLASGAASYRWSPPTGLSCINCPNPLASPSGNTTYTVVGTDINGCKDSTFVSIGVTPKRPFTFSQNDSICEGESVQLFATGGEIYRWSPPDGLSSTTTNSPTATPERTTTYTVIVQQGICFADTGRITVAVHPNPTVNAGPDHRIVAGASVNLVATGTFTDFYLWTPDEDLSCTDCSATIATPKKTTTYKITASNKFGCEAYDEVTIFISCDNSQVFIPNTFTPNGDGNNDRFYASGAGISIINQFRVYNRWGELMYSAQNIQAGDDLKGWDGTYKGEDLKPDVYVYIIEATCFNGTPMKMKGDISLIR